MTGLLSSTMVGRTINLLTTDPTHYSLRSHVSRVPGIDVFDELRHQRIVTLADEVSRPVSVAAIVDQYRRVSGQYVVRVQLVDRQVVRDLCRVVRRDLLDRRLGVVRRLQAAATARPAATRLTARRTRVCFTFRSTKS
ncbi:hypothetical protein ABFJ78_24490 [Amycolatopsis sp. MEPSY49]